MNKSLILLLASTGLIACMENKDKEEFTLNGSTKGIDEGTKLLLINTLDDKIIDSTIVSDNEFQMTGTLEKPPTRALLRTVDFSEYRFIWLENREMNFHARNSNFRNAEISGSETENLAQILHEQTDVIESREKRLKIEMEFVKSHPNSIVSASILAVYATSWGKEITSELFIKLSQENKESEYGKNISNYIKLNKNPKIGEEFVDFTMKDENGQSKKLSDLKGKSLLLEFWASWCGPCRKENPNLLQTYKRFHPGGFEIFAVSLDNDKDSWIKAIQEDSLTWHHVSDLKGDANAASLIYGVGGIPDNFLIDKNGIIVARNLRGAELNKKLLEIIRALR